MRDLSGSIGQCRFLQKPRHPAAAFWFLSAARRANLSEAPRDMRLGAFLRQEVTRPWQWGEHDCGLWLADWFVFKTGRPDPAANLRGTYTTPAECYARYGGTAPLPQVRTIARNGRLIRTHDPEPGDIAVLDLRTEGYRLIAGCIRTVHGWVFIASAGARRARLTKIHDAEGRMIAAWRIP